MNRTFLCCLSILLLYACQKHTDNPPGGVNVYVAGSDNNRATVWKNGQAMTLGLSPHCTISQSLGLAVSGSDVYVSGLQVTDSNYAVPCYWKNGQPVILDHPNGNNDGAAFAIAISGSNIYLAGDLANEHGVNMGYYWENGQPDTLNFLPYALAFSGSNLYMTGYASTPVLWDNEAYDSLQANLNGILNGLFDGNAIALDGSDVYVAGSWTNVPYYWKNGVQVTLPEPRFNGVSYPVLPTAIAVSGSDVYLAGSSYIGAYWKNDSAFVFTDGTHEAVVNGMALAGNDVYITGAEYNGTNAVAKYWKNGQPVILSDGTHFAETRAICVTQ